MTNEELARIKARAEAATKGPWTSSGDAKWDNADVRDAQGYSVFEAWAVNAGDHGQNLTNADRDFISAAREDVPALLAEIERLRGLVKAAEWTQCDDPHWASCPWGCTARLIDCDFDKSTKRHRDDCPAFTESGDVR